LFPRIGFIGTNLETPSRAVVRFYNKRGTTEQWIKEGKQAVKMTRLTALLPLSFRRDLSILSLQPSPGFARADGNSLIPWNILVAKCTGTWHLQPL
jgi:hypothetical protein